MAKPFTRAQTLQNRAFLRALARTGNTHLAVEQTGLSRSTMHYRRKAHPAFAQAWDAAIAMAQARLHQAGGRVPPVAPAPQDADSLHRTAGGESVVSRGRSGKLQVRRAPRGMLTRHCEQAFLAALSATANVKLSAAAAGAPHIAFYRRRNADPAFAREMRMALQLGYERLEMALIESWSPQAHAHDEWRHNDPPPIPPMTANQALQLLYLHQKEARLLAEPAHIKRRRGESHEAHSFRLSAMYEERMQRAREAFDVAEAERRERGEPHVFGPKVPRLMDLAQVHGWSRAEGEESPEQDRALFGGRRLTKLGE